MANSCLSATCAVISANVASVAIVIRRGRGVSARHATTASANAGSASRRSASSSVGSIVMNVGIETSAAIPSIS